MTLQKMKSFRLSQNRLENCPASFAKQMRREWAIFMEKIVNKGLYYRFIMDEEGEKPNEN